MVCIRESKASSSPNKYRCSLLLRGAEEVGARCGWNEKVHYQFNHPLLTISSNTGNRQAGFHPATVLTSFGLVCAVWELSAQRRLVDRASNQTGWTAGVWPSGRHRFG